MKFASWVFYYIFKIPQITMGFLTFVRPKYIVDVTLQKFRGFL